MLSDALALLDHEERLIIDSLAVAEDALSLTLLSRMLAHFGVREGRRAPSAETVRRIAAPLIERGLLTQDSRVAVAPALGEAAFRVLLAEDRLEPFYARLAELEPVRTPQWRGYPPDCRPGTVRRELRRAMLAGDLETYTQLKRPYRGSLPLTRWFLEPLQVQQLDRLHPTVRVEVLITLARLAFDEAQAVPGLIEYVDARRAGAAQPALSAISAGFFLLAGDLSRAQRALTDLDADSSPTWAWLHLAQGDLKRAAKVFAKALSVVRKEVGSRKILLAGPEGALVPLGLLLDGSASMEKQAASMLAYLEDEHPRHLHPALTGWPHLRRLLDPELEPALPAEHPFAALMEGLAARWSAQALPEARLSKAIADAGAVGWRWVAAELEALRGGSSLAWATPLVSHREATPPWALRLAKLDEALRDDNPQKSKRIAWTLQRYGDGLHLDAREQTLGARGEWSKGRVVALSRLHGDPNSVAGMSDADLRIASHLSARTYRSYSGYPETEYRWGDSVWGALAGHPAVFTPQGEPLTIVMLKPRLVHREARGQVHLEVVPPAGSGVVVQPVGTHGYEVFEFNAKQQELAALLSEGLSVPASESPRLEALLERLGEHFQRDAGGLGAKALPGDPRPVVRLWPEGRGVKARVGVTPAGAGGVMLEPGVGATTLLARVSGRPARVTRDLGAEALALARFERATPALLAADWDGEHHRFSEAEQALPFLEELLHLGEAHVVVEWPEGASLRLRASLNASALRLSVRSAKDWLTADGALRVDEALTLELSALLDQVRGTQGRFLRLDDGSFVALTERLRQQLDALARVNTGRGQAVRLHPLAAESLAGLVEDAGSATVDAGWEEGLARLRHLPERPPVPEGLAAELRPYQQDGFVWLARMAELGAGVCLADDMGLGKTLMALALLLRRAPLGPALVLAPTSVTGNWAQESWRFAPGLRILRFGEGDRAAMLAALGPGDLVLCSYGLLVSEATALSAVSWATLVLDEAQAIKNPATQRHKAALGLSAAHRVALTGTPLENHLGELHALFAFLNPGFFGSPKRFGERLRRPIEAGERGPQRQLSRLIAPFVLRRTKAQVLQELPPRTEVDVLVEPSPEEAAFAEALRRRALASLEREGAAGAVQVLAELTRLRLAACSPRLVEGGEHLTGVSSKLEAFGELIERLGAGQHRALVFSQFVKHLSLLREWLDAQGVTYQYLDGATPAAERDRRVAAFQAGEGQVFLISLRAGGSGLNLTAADYVIHVDPWWNPAVEDQASDRAHRIGQTRPVTIYRLISAGSIEERILSLHRGKRALADQILSGAGAAGGVSAEELMALLRAE